LSRRHSENPGRISTFWARQLATPQAKGHSAFDFTFGIAMPAAALYLVNLMFGSLFGVAFFVWNVWVLISLAALLVWLVAGGRLGTGHGVLEGVLSFGATTAFCAAVPGLVLFLGVWARALVSGSDQIAALLALAGVLPFLTFVVFLRNTKAVHCRAVEGVNKAAHADAEPRVRDGRALDLDAEQAAVDRIRAAQWKAQSAAVVGFMAVLMAPAVIAFASRIYADPLIESAVGSDAALADRSVRRLAPLFWCRTWCYEHMRDQFRAETDSERQERLADVYGKLTGRYVGSDSP
jgi:hypothetical protein